MLELAKQSGYTARAGRTIGDSLDSFWGFNERLAAARPTDDD